MQYDVVIIGAGLAGSSAAIRLARCNFGVLLLEKKKLPAHKLCGEFLSTEVAAELAELGLLDAVKAAGAQPMHEALVTTHHGAAFKASLPGTALGLSRRTLDRLLFEKAGRAGAETQDDTLVVDVSGTLEDGFCVQTRRGDEVRAALVLGAYGKRGRLDRSLERRFLEEQSPLVAFKAHFTGMDLDGQIELHTFPGGYCGFSPVEDGRVNACWIADQEALRDAGGRPEAMIDTVLSRNQRLAARFDRLHQTADGFEAVSQITLARKSLFAKDVCMIGDTAAMIAPLCGDGMAMALRTSALVVPPATSFLNGHIGGDDFRRHYGDVWADEFTVRLHLGRWLHKAFFHPRLMGAGVRLCSRLPILGHWLIRATRG